MTVPSATTINMTACPSSTAGSTSFGTVQPGTGVALAGNCTITFGSSNDSSMLRMGQADRRGVAMYQPSDGTVDASLNGGAHAVLSTVGTNQFNAGLGVVVQDTGRVVVASTCGTPANGWDLCVGRFNENGTVDTGFGTGGATSTPVTWGNNADITRGLVAQPDGKLLLFADCWGDSYDFCMARFETNGALDASFSGGTVNTAVSAGGIDVIYGVGFQADGSIIAGGYCVTGGASGTDMCVVRYTPSGAVDTSFGTAGTVFVGVGPSGGEDRARAVVVQPDGKIVLGGNCAMTGTGPDACVVRLLANGAVDTSFGTSGVVTLPVGPGAGVDQVWALGLQPDGKILLAGQCDFAATTLLDSCIGRLTSTGVLDTTFNSTGWNTTPFVTGARNDRANGLHLQPDGKVVLVGTCDTATNGSEPCVSRFTAGGVLDTSFGSGGVVTQPSFSPWGDFYFAVTPAHDGAFVAVGNCDTGGTTNVDTCIQRFGSDAGVGQHAGGSNDWTPSATSMFAACLAAVGGGASAQMTVDASCAASNASTWTAVPAVSTKVAYANAPTTTATASLRFGLRVASSQKPGSYVAPIDFTVLAPNI